MNRDKQKLKIIWRVEAWIIVSYPIIIVLVDGLTAGKALIAFVE